MVSTCFGRTPWKRRTRLIRLGHGEERTQRLPAADLAVDLSQAVVSGMVLEPRHRVQPVVVGEQLVEAPLVFARQGVLEGRRRGGLRS